MPITLNTRTLARAAIAAVLAVQTATAATVPTTYNAGDLFIGFRSSSAASTLAVNIGSATNYLPTALGGTWDGNAFNVTFGLVPGTATVVTNLNLDLTAVFGSSWADNPVAEDGSGVHWAVAGISHNTAANTPINGLSARSIFLTIAESAPGTISDAPSISAFTAFGTAFNSFAQGSGGNSFKNRQSTANSSAAYIGTTAGAANTNTWGARIGSVGSTFNSGVLGEQALSGPFSGPTDSVLDLWLSPNTDSTLVSVPTYLGSFSLNASGELTYGAVPEPGSLALLGLGAALLGFSRRRPTTAATSPSNH
jgi:hypothetical protein